MTIEALLERIAIALEKSSSAQILNLEALPPPPPPGASEPPKRRGRPPKNAGAGVTLEDATDPTGVGAPEAAPAVAPVEDKVYTEGDVRNALVALQTTTGSRDKSMEILGKYSGGGTTLGKLPPKSYAAVIKACIEAGAAA